MVSDAALRETPVAGSATQAVPINNAGGAAATSTPTANAIIPLGRGDLSGGNNINVQLPSIPSGGNAQLSGSISIEQHRQVNDLQQQSLYQTQSTESHKNHRGAHAYHKDRSSYRDYIRPLSMAVIASSMMMSYYWLSLMTGGLMTPWLGLGLLGLPIGYLGYLAYREARDMFRAGRNLDRDRTIRPRDLFGNSKPRKVKRTSERNATNAFRASEAQSSSSSDSSTNIQFQLSQSGQAAPQSSVPVQSSSPVSQSPKL